MLILKGKMLRIHKIGVFLVLLTLTDIPIYDRIDSFINKYVILPTLEDRKSKTQDLLSHICSVLRQPLCPNMANNRGPPPPGMFLLGHQPHKEDTILMP